MQVFICFIFSILFSLNVVGQSSLYFYKGNREAVTEEIIAPALLAQQLCLPYNTEKEKVESIFKWITENISYRTKVLTTRSGKDRKPLEDDDTSLVLKPLNVRVAENVLRRREAVCDGYARLFKTLCDFAGIQSELITGYATGYRTTAFRSNHTWNAVAIDNKWYLLDATWASGYINYKGDYVKNYDSKYFLTPPQIFIKDHYPENIKWSLLSTSFFPHEFNQSPFRLQGMERNKIQSFKPLKGVIEAKAGDTVKIELESALALKEAFVSADPYYEFALLPFLNIHVQNTTTTINSGNKIILNYIVPPHAKEWLYVIMNGEIVMRYRLKTNKIAETKSYPDSVSAN